jgi:hypothetical protein
VELAEHLEEGDMGARIVNDSLGAILDQKFEQLQGLSGQQASTRKMIDVPCRSASTLPRPFL